MKKLDIGKLNRLYQDSERVDKSDFAEKRSNVLLCAGDHYNKQGSKRFSTVRTQGKNSSSKKLRLVKNHVYRVVKTYTNSIVSKVPGVTPTPKNEGEMQDRKDAELNKAVWQDLKDRHKLTAKFSKYAQEFVEIGEVAVKVTWNPSKGEIVGYAQKVEVDEKGNEYPLFDEMDQPIADKDDPVFSGDFDFDTIHAFNLLRCPTTEDMRDSPYLINRKMVDKGLLAKTYSQDEEKLKSIGESSKSTFVVFDSDKGEYTKTKDKILVKEFYYRPCHEYPRGYFYIATEDAILEQGELPYGIFPIVWVGFDEFATTPRAKSIIKVARPYQAEINRAASQEATHQITLGDDKIIYQSGSSLEQGSLLPGVRGISVNGAAPTILPGRTGSQYTEYIENQKRELYQAVMLDEIFAEKSVNQDPYALLFSSMKQKSVFQPYAEKFQNFLIEICELTLQLAKHYLPDTALIAAIGRNEAINIEEFRKTTKLCYQVTIEATSEDAETLMGKQITYREIMQYVGKQLDPSSIGKMINNMPFVNNEDSFSELTIDDDNVTNDMLLIERGGVPKISEHDNNKFYIKKLTHRMKQPDFDMLSPEIKNIYTQFLTAHQQDEVRKQQQILASKDKMIPTGGALVTCQLRVPDPEKPGSSKQVRIPYESIMDLVRKLESQGKSLSELENINQGALAQMAQQMGEMGNQQPQESQPMPMPTQNNF